MSKIKPLYNNILASYIITSDNHIDIKHPCYRIPMWYLCRSLKAAQNSKAPTAAYITVGDITSRGSEENWRLTKMCFDKYKSGEQIFITLGNHDACSDNGYVSAFEQYLKNVNEITGRKQEKTYFSTTINGCSLIFLGSTAESGCESKLGEEEISWFRNEMEKSQRGKPVFVFCHQSLNGRHGLPRTWEKEEKPERDPFEGGIGEESSLVEDILKLRKNVFYFSGHSHMGLCGENMSKKEGYASFENENGIELINLPSLACGNHHGEDNSMGIGLVLEVYADKVVIRPYSFARCCMNKKVMIRNGKPYLEVKLTDE